MKIGYQGIEGSNSEEVAHIYGEKIENEIIEYIPLINSQNVVDALTSGKIDLGVMAISNSQAGIVTETEDALKGVNYEIIQNIEVSIHHSVFKKKNAKLEEIKTIASHIQALGQTRLNIEKLFPNCNKIEVEDTALAAKYLAENKFEDNVAIICKRKAGEMFGLDLVYDNIEDDNKNATLFGVYRIK